MIRQSLLFSLILAVSSVVDGAEDVNASHRFLLLTSHEPLILDFVVNIDGKPLGDERERIVREMINGSDANGDGRTTWDEAADGELFKFGGLKYLAKEKPKSFRRRLRLFDEIDNGLVDVAEASRLWSLYTNSNELISTSGAYHASVYRPNFPHVFACVDEDQNKILSAKEIANSTARLLTQDANDDEILDYQELARFTKQAREMVTTTVRPELSALLHVDELDSEFILGQLKTVYRSSENDAEQRTLYRQFVKRFDSNRDEKLDVDEISAIAAATADLEFETHLGIHKKLRPCRIRAMKPALKDRIATTTSGSTVSARIGSLNLQVVLSRPTGVQDIASQAQTMFNTLDLDNNKYLELPEIEKIADVGRAADFASWDANNDGKVFLDELTHFLQKLSSLHGQSIAIVSLSRGSYLANWADVNADNRLSLREMKSANERIASCDRNKDGQVSPDEIPSTVEIRLTQRVADVPFRLRPFGYFQQIANAPAGPDWFIRMDRNGDGDVSRREFLGDLEQFNGYDKDRDGLIDSREAAAGVPKK